MKLKKVGEGIWKPDTAIYNPGSVAGKRMAKFSTDAKRFNVQHKVYANNDINLKRKVLRTQFQNWRKTKGKDLLENNKTTVGKIFSDLGF